MNTFVYSWNRYWSPPDGTVQLDHHGFLMDPNIAFGGVADSGLAETEALEHVPCLVLLGEPGSGKSAELERMRRSSCSGEFNQLHIDLNQFATDDRLERSIFDTPQFREWECGAALEIVLDSLDECLIRVETVSAILSHRFAGIKTERLRLRIACRTAAWPGSLGNMLKETWGEGRFQILELQPLRETDVIAAAGSAGVDPDDFADAVKSQALGPLAARPITLQLLLRLSGALSTSRWDIYERGLRALSEESNDSRRETRRTGGLSPDQRLLVASRIATATVLSSHSEVWTGLESGYIPLQSIPVSNLCGPEVREGNTLEITESMIREVLDTGLFTSRGTARFGWAHHTFAEFLAARYLESHSLGHSQLKSLLFHPNDVGGRVVPQLDQVAAWLAPKAPFVLSSLLDSSPQVLLRTDAALIDEVTKQKLCRVLLKKAAVGEIAPFGLARNLQALKYDTIAEDLKPVIIDNTRGPMERRLAIDIAEACHSSELSEVLVGVALDPAEEQTLRVNAGYAVARLADLEERGRLKPLLEIDEDEDPYGELRGVALITLWPDLIAAGEVMAALEKPVDHLLLGSLGQFAYSRFVQALKPEDLPSALKWLGELPERRSMGHHVEQLVEPLIVAGWHSVDEPGVLRALARAIVNRLKKDYQLEESVGDSGLQRLINEDSNTRRKIITEVVVDDDADTASLKLISYYSEPLVVVEDVPWLVEQTLSADSSLKGRWARLLRFTFRLQNPQHFNVILNASEQEMLIRMELAPFIDAIELDSVLARDFKESYARQQRPELPTTEATGKPPLVDRLEQSLSSVESGNVVAFRRIPQQLTEAADLSESDHVPGGPDLSVLPGWDALDAALIQRLCAAAVTYLENERSPEDDWTSVWTLPADVCFAYQAFRLLLDYAPERLDQLPDDVWNDRASTLVRYPFINHKKAVDRHRQLARMAMQKAGQAFAGAIRRAALGENSVYGRVDCMARLEGVAGLGTIALDISKVDGMTSMSLVQSLGVALRHETPGAQDHAESLLDLAPDDARDIPRNISSAAALLLYSDDAGWNVLWPLFDSDPEFGKRVLLEAFKYGIGSNEMILPKLTEQHLADLFVWLHTCFSHLDENAMTGVSSLGPEDQFERFRVDVIEHLKFRGTADSISALKNVAERLPEEQWIRRSISEAIEITLRETWAPPTPEQIFMVCKSDRHRLVRSESELHDVVTKALEQLEQELQGETPAVADLWNLRPIRPKDEETISDYVKRFLDRGLRNNLVLANREVQIRRGIGNGGRPGERTDVHVDAFGEIDGAGNRTRFTVIIEVKGCWNGGLFEDMEHQLANRYLAENHCQNGIYLVGCFHCPQWDDTDRRKHRSHHTVQEDLKPALECKASELSADGRRITEFVMNTALR